MPKNERLILPNALSCLIYNQKLQMTLMIQANILLRNRVHSKISNDNFLIYFLLFIFIRYLICSFSC